ncbi:DUF4382 domain-containing protein [Alteromonas flava]|uniref:DUF4382 domain-containing protein n=1 Tax=Alteromonas flava TaxID=2048003 RepID=UPI000C281DC4|nr:DUF4382 domain-containing protein [Alteromonas flava]
MRAFKYSAIGSLFILTACGGGSSGPAVDDPVVTPAPTPASLTLNVSDAPVDDALAVVVEFDSIELTGNGDPIVYNVTDEQGGARQIDLLAFQGEDFATLLDSVEIEAGTYGQLRLNVTNNSFIEMTSGTFDLRVPSNQLKLDGFTIDESEQALYTVEFDLRKSLVAPPGQDAILLKPRGVRVVENSEAGTIAGTVDESLLVVEQCADKVDIAVGNAVYIYAGTDFTLDVLGDDADEPADINEISPVAIGEVSLNTDTEYAFEVAYLPVGDYTVGFTCLAANDEPETDENVADGFSILLQQSVSVSAQQRVSVTFE